LSINIYQCAHLLLNSKTDGFNKPITWIFIGGAISILGTIIVLYATYLNNINSSAKSDKMKITGEVTQTEVLKLRDDNQNLEHSISTLKKENLELHSRLTNKTVEIFDHQTGGNSFGEVIIEPVNNETANLYFRNHGKYPMYDVEFRIHDISFDQKESLTMEMIDQDIKNLQMIRIGNVPDGALRDLSQIKRNFSGKKKMFMIDINSRNGGLHQEIMFRREIQMHNGIRAWPDIWYFKSLVARDTKVIHRSSNAPDTYIPTEP
jgi:hypothetical protein